MDELRQMSSPDFLCDEILCEFGIFKLTTCDFEKKNTYFRGPILKKLDYFTLEMSKNHLIRNFLRNGRLRVNNFEIDGQPPRLKFLLGDLTIESTLRRSLIF